MLGSWCFFQTFSHTTNLKRWVCCYLLDCLFFDVWHQKPSENNRMDQPTLQTQMQLLISYHNHQNGGVTVVFAFHLWQDLESIFRAPQCPPEVFLGAFCCPVNQNCSFHPFEKHLSETKVKMDRKIRLWLKVKFLQVNFIKFVLAEGIITSFDRVQWFFVGTNDPKYWICWGDMLTCFKGKLSLYHSVTI